MCRSPAGYKHMLAKAADEQAAPANVGQALVCASPTAFNLSQRPHQRTTTSNRQLLAVALSTSTVPSTPAGTRSGHWCCL
jgi:hypothetical protein